MVLVIARSKATKQSIAVIHCAGLLRGACHRARIRATRWLAMTIDALSRQRVAASAQAEILEFGEGADGDRLDRDQSFAEKVRRRRAREQQRDAGKGPGRIAGD